MHRHHDQAIHIAIRVIEIVKRLWFKNSDSKIRYAIPFLFRRVPQSDGVVVTYRENLSPVACEHDVAGLAGVALVGVNRFAGGVIPQSQRFVVTGRHDPFAIRRERDLKHAAAVAF